MVSLLSWLIQISIWGKFYSRLSILEIIGLIFVWSCWGFQSIIFCPLRSLSESIYSYNLFNLSSNFFSILYVNSKCSHDRSFSNFDILFTSYYIYWLILLNDSRFPSTNYGYAYYSISFVSILSAIFFNSIFNFLMSSIISKFYCPKNSNLESNIAGILS